MQKYSAPLSQYFTEPHFSAITATCLLEYVSTRFVHLETGGFASSSQKSSSSVRLVGEHLCMAVFRSCQRCLSGFRYWHMIYFCLKPSHWSSWWKVNLCPSTNSSADSNRFSSKIALCLTPSTFPIPAEERHLMWCCHHQVWYGDYFSTTCSIWHLGQKRYILVSPDQSTFHICCVSYMA